MTSESAVARRDNSDVVAEHLEPASKRILDVGCGDGGLARTMTRQGATVIGLECSPEQLEKARAWEPAGDEAYVGGVGEDLPFGDASMDAVVFFNSLHHVAVAAQAAALAEAARVVRPGGVIYVAEPVAEGPHFRLTMPVDDETRVRAAAYAVIRDAGALGLGQEKEFTYTHAVVHPSFEAFHERMVTINPARRGTFAAKEAMMRANFERLGKKGEDGWAFDQPMRVTILRKAS
ncbi:MAG: class I SAM-dependent methyltransferase [Alphaproteobacteria bacterium]|nr:class I SAM-dependent methyltransferase [Alphaproteobacteria bacterium]